MHTPYYNTQHSPVGANASFTLGMQGAAGGMGIGLAGPARENFWIGYADPATQELRCLPFFAGADKAEEERFGISAEERSWHVVALEQPERHLDCGLDRFTSGPFTLAIHTQAPQIEDPAGNDRSETKLALVPGLLCTLSLDNSDCGQPRRFFLGWQGSHPQWAMHVQRSSDMVGISQGDQCGFFGAAVDGWSAALGFDPAEAFERISHTGLSQNRLWGLGTCGMISVEVAAHTQRTVTLACAFYQQGTVTTGRFCQPWYQRWWNSLEEVAWELLVHSKTFLRNSEQASALTTGQTLSPEKRWMLSQALHSYYGSTWLLCDAGAPDEPLWIVNEGEYRMMNTLDLTVDMVYYEMLRHPWTVRSVLDQFRKRHSYRDNLGISFAHDMGVAGVWAPPGRSAYELAGRSGCFSFMTSEELVNYALVAISYTRIAGDNRWLERHDDVLQEIIQSLCARTADAEGNPSGVIQQDSHLCAGGHEITTYDSLDASLGQARLNLYLSVKCWATWLGLYQLAERKGDEAAATTCWDNAILASQAIQQAIDPATGTIPALLDGSCASLILPAVEGLIFPAWWGDTRMVESAGPFGSLIKALRHHFEMALSSGKCLFGDGSFKLSETSDNSWLSKIYLLQAVCQRIFGWDPGIMAEADQRHQSWLLDPRNAVFAWSDQFLAGEVCGSRYYPRGTTAALWLADCWAQ